MKHTIRTNGQVRKIDCEFGSKVFDKNGREIIEGDIVVFDGDADRYPVSFRDGAFYVADVYPLLNYSDDDFEIVGHIDEEG